jgi:hypothetical protein
VKWLSKDVSSDCDIVPVTEPEDSVDNNVDSKEKLVLEASSIVVSSLFVVSNAVDTSVVSSGSVWVVEESVVLALFSSVVSVVISYNELVALDSGSLLLEVLASSLTVDSAFVSETEVSN